MKKPCKTIKSFRKFCEHDDLNEGVVRTGSLLITANRARRSGDDAQKAFEAGQNSLRRPVHKDDATARLDQLHDALGHLLAGLVHMRQQSGHHLAVDLAGHLLAAQAHTALKSR